MLLPESSLTPGPDHAIDHLGQVVVGGAGAPAQPPGDLAAEDEVGLHLPLALHINYSPLLDSIASLSHDQSDFLRSLRQVYAFNLHRICVTVKNKKLLEIRDEMQDGDTGIGCFHKV